MKKHFFYFDIAKVKIKVELQHSLRKPWTHEYFSSSIVHRYNEYIINPTKKVDFTIHVNFKEDPPKVYVDKQTKIAYLEYYEELSKNKINIYYHISSMAFDQILLKIVDQVLGNSNGFILHASGVSYKGNAYLFLAESGGGKSTMTQIVDKDIQIINDDRLAIRKIANKYKVFALPEIHPLILKNRETGINLEGIPISKVFFLKKSNRWSFIETHDIEQPLITQLLTLQVNKRNTIKNILEFSKTSFFLMEFPKKPKSNDFITLLNKKPFYRI